MDLEQTYSLAFGTAAQRRSFREHEIEAEITKHFRLCCKTVGFEEANRLFDLYGCNSDETYEVKLEMAEWLSCELVQN